MMEMDPTTLSRGVNAVWDTDNIAIIVLFLVSIGEGILIYFLLKNLLAMKDVLATLASAIAVLNEREREQDVQSHR